MSRCVLFFVAVMTLVGCSDIDDKLTGRFSGYTVVSGGSVGEQVNDSAMLHVESSSVTLTSPAIGTIRVENYDSEYLGNGTQGLSGLGELTMPDGSTYRASLAAKVLYGASEASASFVVAGNEMFARLAFTQGSYPEIYNVSGSYRGMAYVNYDENTDVGGNAQGWKAPVVLKVNVDNASSDNPELNVEVSELTDGLHSLSGLKVDFVSVVKSSNGYLLGSTSVSTAHVLLDGVRKSCAGTMDGFALSPGAGDFEVIFSLFLDDVPVSVTLYVNSGK